MNLINNLEWSKIANDHFTFSEIFEINNENCSVEYSFKTSRNELVAYGYDLLQEEINKEEIYSLLVSDKSKSGENSLITKMFKFYNFGGSPIVFLVSKNMIFYMPCGIRQINERVWEATSDINIFIQILNTAKAALDEKANEEEIRRKEEENTITIKHFREMTNELQFKLLTIRPLWFEDTKFELIPCEMDSQCNKSIRYKTELTRMCILNGCSEKSLKIKVETSNSAFTDGGGVDPEEWGYSSLTKYYVISVYGEPEESKLNQNETYSVLEIYNEYR